MAKFSDDVIRIRVDTTGAVAEFMTLLAEQAAKGETMAPANPANRAIYRELAPFRLVEYTYVDPTLEGIDGVYIGFADGALYSVAEDIPETVIDALVAEDHTDLPPIYLYILLREPRSAAEIDHFLDALAAHLNRPLVGVFRDQMGRMAARSYALDASAEQRDLLARQVTRSVLEANRHFDKARTLRRLAERNLAADGRAFAQITYKFAQHVVEFPNSAERDDFIAWSRTMCEWIYSRWCSWEDLGLSEILRPAEVAAEPTGEGVAVRLVAPSDYEGGAPWQAFGGNNAATAMHFTQSDAAVSDDGLRQSLELAQGYWRYVTETIAAGEALARALADQRRRRGMKLD
ncbi:hypothetical protein [Magnetospirillum sulfuroxidans]|uniref:Uncharacterized protein n=1 Tax=Magnetospirillum sulfuroxidans TaxID=611300 RepID=A0ABS5I8J3_9PROT|nr:hypothetical protein [Magnetospirillum sulfuroxidans]MBR9970731.1 hypothetical protein [Magnetospirillum sulfuroxidans]